MHYIETNRLLLREMIAEDYPGIFELDSDAEVHRYLGNRPLQTIDDAKAVIAFIQKQYAENGIGRWAVIEKESGAFMGWAGFKLITEMCNNRSGYYDLGYRFIRKYWGKGYATEAAATLINYGFNTLQLTEICAIADTGNQASVHVLQKSGFCIIEEYLDEGIPHYFFRLEKA